MQTTTTTTGWRVQALWGRAVSANEARRQQLVGWATTYRLATLFSLSTTVKQEKKEGQYHRHCCSARRTRAFTRQPHRIWPEKTGMVLTAASSTVLLVCYKDRAVATQQQQMQTRLCNPLLQLAACLLRILRKSTGLKSASRGNFWYRGRTNPFTKRRRSGSTRGPVTTLSTPHHFVVR